MKLKIEKRAWEKLKAYTSNCQYEIGGLGKVTIDGGDFILHDAEIFEQTVTSATTNMTAETLAKFQTEKVKNRESVKDYKLWWHSHAKMKTFFSQTDINTINGSGSEFPWLVSLVVNHEYETTARVDIYQPVHVHVSLEVEILEENDAEIEKACIEEIAKKVTLPTATSFGFGRYHDGGYYGGYYSRVLDDDAPATIKNGDKNKRLRELRKELKQKERALKHLESIGSNTKAKEKLINQTEEEIADISMEIDYLTDGTLPSNNTLL